MKTIDPRKVANEAMARANDTPPGAYAPQYWHDVPVLARALLEALDELSDMSERRVTLQGRVIELIEQRDRFVKCLNDVRESLAEDISGGEEFDKLLSAQYIREVMEMLV